MQDPFSRERIFSLLSDQSIRQTVTETLKSQKLFTSPATLKAEVISSPLINPCSEDIEKVFSYFGEVSDLRLSSTTAFIIFKDPVSAFFAQKVLNGKEIPELRITFEVTWHVEERRRVPFADIQNTSSSKLTARFDIMVENDEEFQVARRIIGAKGINMKTIVEKCCKGMNGPAHDIVKLRLRGKGSGFKEGPERIESSDRLHICISSKYNDRLQMAAAEVERLIDSVYVEYDLFRRAKGLPPTFFKTKL
jgi:hypothetical protein